MHSVMKSEKRTTCFELEWFEKYRTELMGIAAIGIILCHANATGVMLPSIIRKIFSFGTECVDLFLMLSGIGIYYSLSKKTSLKQWYLKRYLRIGVPYLLISVPYFIWFVINRGVESETFYITYPRCHIGQNILVLGMWLCCYLCMQYHLQWENL